MNYIFKEEFKGQEVTHFPVEGGSILLENANQEDLKKCYESGCTKHIEKVEKEIEETESTEELMDSVKDILEDIVEFPVKKKSKKKAKK